MDMHQPDLNKILGQSTQMLTDYHRMIVDSPEMPNKPDGLSNMTNMLADTQSSLQKVMDDNSVTNIKTDKLKDMNEAINDLLNDSSAVKKMQAVQDTLYGDSTAFLSELKSMQALMTTIEEIQKTRGRRGSSD
jgi:chemotaxis methyl-accepting protein methylase